MARPIVSDEAKFDGAPHIDGTEVTVDAVQAFWKRPGVGAREIRAQFPQLTEAELGEAVTYAPPREPLYSFVAEVEGPPRRRLRIWSEEPGWMFLIEVTGEAGVEQPGFDAWEESWERILLYPEEYAPRGVEWRDERSGKIIDIYAINPEPSV
jgi:uncharacterized protein (DUF433 family)